MKSITSDLPPFRIKATSTDLPPFRVKSKPTAEETACTLEHSYYVELPCFDYQTSSEGVMRVRLGSTLHRLYVDSKAVCLEVNRPAGK